MNVSGSEQMTFLNSKQAAKSNGWTLKNRKIVYVQTTPSKWHMLYKIVMLKVMANVIKNCNVTVNGISYITIVIKLSNLRESHQVNKKNLKPFPGSPSFDPYTGMKNKKIKFIGISYLCING